MDFIRATVIVCYTLFIMLDGIAIGMIWSTKMDKKFEEKQKENDGNYVSQ